MIDRHGKAIVGSDRPCITTRKWGTRWSVESAEEGLGVLAQPGVGKSEDHHGSTRNEDDVHLLSFTRVLPRAVAARLLPPHPRMQMKQNRQISAAPCRP